MSAGHVGRVGGPLMNTAPAMPESVRKTWGDAAVYCTTGHRDADGVERASWHHRDYHKPAPRLPRRLALRLVLRQLIRDLRRVIVQ